MPLGCSILARGISTRPANWNPAAVPTGTAFFSASNTTALTFSAPTTVGGFTFNAGAPAYSFTVTGLNPLTFNGVGIANHSSSVPAFVLSNGTMNFNGASSAGNANITNNNGDLNFSNTSTAGSATITNNFLLNFSNTSTAGSAAITNNGFLFSTTRARLATPPSPPAPVLRCSF